MSDDIVISVKNVTKDFQLTHHKSSSIKDSIVQVFEKKDKSVDTFHALRGVSFDIKKGEFFGILGRNGSGKSTLLKIISEIYYPTSGHVKHRGSLVSFIELGVGFKAELSGRENVYLNGALLGFSRDEINDRYDEIVAFAELEQFMDQQLKNYSSGMKVRLAFAVAIQAQSDILILDEVLAVGDASFQRKCYDYFRSLKADRSKTIVFVTHSMGAAREYCDRAVLIENGKIACQGDTEKVADEYLKLFANSTTNTGDVDRWGTGEVTIENLTLDSIDSKHIDLTVKLKAKKDIIDVKFGIQVKDAKDHTIAAVNSINVEGGSRLRFRSGEIKTLKFKLDNIFGNDEYSISAIVNLFDGVTTCDSWSNILNFTNNKQHVYYPVVIPGSYQINYVT